MGALELKIPPAILVAFAAAAMWGLAAAASALSFSFPGRLLVGSVLAATGIIVIFSGVVSFRRARTTVNPMQPGSASSLVVAGIYHYTRNPMYLGFLMVLCGWGVYLANPGALAVLPAFVLYMNRFQIAPEERALTALFPTDYPQYKSRVRRWL